MYAEDGVTVTAGTAGVSGVTGVQVRQGTDVDVSGAENAVTLPHNAATNGSAPELQSPCKSVAYYR